MNPTDAHPGGDICWVVSNMLLKLKDFIFCVFVFFGIVFTVFMVSKI